MLGTAVRRALTDRGHRVSAPPRHQADLVDPQACRLLVENQDVVVNTAAWTKVDDAEAHEAQAFEANALGVANLAAAATKTGTRLVHISTDYVFDGRATTPYREDAALQPVSAYGRTKAAGEWAARALSPGCVIVRTAWLYGPGGPNFVRTMARLAVDKDTVRVVDDQTGQPTTTRDVARLVADAVEAGLGPGVLHATCEGQTSWYGLARAVFEDLGHDPDRVRPTTTAAFPRPAPRPSYSVLGHEATLAAGLSLLPDWRQSLTETIAKVVEEDRR